MFPVNRPTRAARDSADAATLRATAAAAGPATRRASERLAVAAAAALLFGATTAARADDPVAAALIVTASNASTNELLVFNSSGALLKTIATQGQGGVGGNAGGIAYALGRLAVVNYGSGNVSVFNRTADARLFHLEKVVQTHGSPVSVAFGDGHLYVLTTTQVESHPVGLLSGVAAAADGGTQLLHADGTAAQVGVVKGQLVITEKSNVVETVTLDAAGAVGGPAVLVAGIPSNADTPLGLVTRGDDAYVTIAHSDETSLVRNGAVLTITPSVTQHAPCWLALEGPFLYSSNSPSKSVSRYAVYGQHIVQDAAVAASFNGSPTDIAVRGRLAAVIDANATASHVSVFGVDEDGNLSLRGAATLAGRTTNGVAIVPPALP